MKEVTPQKLNKYFSVTQEAFDMANVSKNRLPNLEKHRIDSLDMIERYISDARHFEEKGDMINAFAALNYAHGWLDAGARLGIFDVHDSRLFVVDDKE